MNATHTNINDLQSNLSKKPDLPLKFYFDGTPINPGYHVTEVKFASIKSQDCGQQSEIELWDEITVQLLDGSPESTQGHMSGSKFLGIIGKALENLKQEDAPYLFFEFAPNNGAIRKLSVKSLEQSDDEFSVSLGTEKAVCKPFQRSKAARAAAALSGQITEAETGGGCCAGGTDSSGNACCG